MKLLYFLDEGPMETIGVFGKDNVQKQSICVSKYSKMYIWWGWGRALVIMNTRVMCEIV